MIKFIEVTSGTTGRKGYINIDKICSFCDVIEDSKKKLKGGIVNTCIDVSTDVHAQYFVQETVEEIKQKLYNLGCIYE